MLRFNFLWGKMGKYVGSERTYGGSLLGQDFLGLDWFLLP